MLFRSPPLPLAVEASIWERGILPGETGMLRKSDDPRGGDASSDAALHRRPASEIAAGLPPSIAARRAPRPGMRPSFSRKPGRRTQRLGRKTQLFQANAGGDPDPLSGSGEPNRDTPIRRRRDSLSRSTAIIPVTTAPRASKSAGLPGIGTKFGELWLMRLLGQGGSAVVYQALHEGLQIPVAVKIPRPDVLLQGEYRMAFRREAAMMANLSHPNIVCVIDFFELDGRDVLVLEYVDGLTVDSLIESAGRITPARVCALGIDICSALNEALGQGIIHRDLKPSNFLLPGSLHVKISDFGLASLYNPLAADVLSRSLSGEHQISGTPRYIAPEQSFPGADVDHRSDIYSLGISFFHMLVGRVPFVSSDPAELIFHHRESRPPSVADLIPDCPEELAELVSQMTAKIPDDRPFDYSVISERLAQIRDRIEN